jgi:hypothetical protein
VALVWEVGWWLSNDSDEARHKSMWRFNSSKVPLMTWWHTQQEWGAMGKFDDANVSTRKVVGISREHDGDKVIRSLRFLVCLTLARRRSSSWACCWVETLFLTALFGVLYNTYGKLTVNFKSNCNTFWSSSLIERFCNWALWAQARSVVVHCLDWGPLHTKGILLMCVTWRIYAERKQNGVCGVTADTQKYWLTKLQRQSSAAENLFFSFFSCSGWKLWHKGMDGKSFGLFLHSAALLICSRWYGTGR